MAVWMKVLHVVTAMWFIGGLMGRAVLMYQASRMSDIKSVAMLVKLAHIFDNWMVIPGSMAVLGFGLVTAWLQHWPIIGSATPINWLLVSTGLYLSIFPLIKLVFIPRGKIFGAALETALTQGQVTPELTAAFHNRAVAWSHFYEYTTTAIIVFLMVAKPF